MRNIFVALLVVAASILAFNYYSLYAEHTKLLFAQASGSKDYCVKVGPSKLATKYLANLRGIEIGASTQNSFNLRRAINVDVMDEQQAMMWQDNDCKPATVHILSSGDNLPFKDSTVDYVLASHVIEHFFDPVKALQEWYRVIKPGGYIFIIAPHHDRTFDKNRSITSLQELIDRHSGKITVSNYATPIGLNYEQKKANPQMLTDHPPQGWEPFKEDDHHHWSVWRTDDFVALVKHLDFEMVEVHDIDDKVGNGFTIVIRK